MNSNAGNVFAQTIEVVGRTGPQPLEFGCIKAAMLTAEVEVPLVTPIPTASPQLTLTPNRVIIGLAIVFFPLLLTLGFWQLTRAAEKRAILQQIQERQAGAPVELDEFSASALAPYTRVIVRGEFDNQHLWLIDNRQRDGRTGFEVVQVFSLKNNQKILVNRGWLAGDVSRKQLPDVPLVAGEVSIFAELYPVNSHPLLNAQGETTTWPKVITEVNVALMADAVGQLLAPGILKLDDASPAALRTEWQAVNMSPERHTGYAIQWFGLAIALVLLTLFASTNLASVWHYYWHKSSTKHDQQADDL
ncbi:SURF1 family protein [Gilvimarinus polysaccharolyticus]|uniref:SURF1 family protein n=1 Tax=Gilvimarinus polysaccharolyticus TaxID=863921 RepID=UPI0006732E5A|nr:SURF1 family protein [Gilvimarinus polysaccharolyticus]